MAVDQSWLIHSTPGRIIASQPPEAADRAHQAVPPAIGAFRSSAKASGQASIGRITAQLRLRERWLRAVRPIMPQPAECCRQRPHHNPLTTISIGTLRSAGPAATGALATKAKVIPASVT
jgi:hypothetical protein